MPLKTIPLHTYLWKICSRCNINCSYCYVYNAADTQWRRQPAMMSKDVARRIASRMLEHLLAHGKQDAAIIFHGGEPLLGGVSHLADLAHIIGDTFAGSGIRLSIGMQSNLLLFNEEIGRFMHDVGMTIGVSIDGPPKINDRFRVDHRGRPTSATLESKLSLLLSDQFRPIFSGFLTVIDPDTDPIEITEYLLSFAPPGIDFLFPLNNYDRRPRGKQRNLDATPYGDWLVQAFDYWRRRENNTSIRIFTSMLRMWCGRATLVESLGLLPVDLIVTETNGEIEAVDSLKSTFDGATRLGFNVFDHSFDEVARDLRVRSRQMGAEALHPTCQSCPLVHVCGGGYVPHRYSHSHGFLNPSVYCSDLTKLILHIREALVDELRTVDSTADTVVGSTP